MVYFLLELKNELWILDCFFKKTADNLCFPGKEETDTIQNIEMKRGRLKIENIAGIIKFKAFNHKDQ